MDFFTLFYLERKETMSKEIAGQNKMAIMPVSKLMLNMGIPIVLSMILQAVYNIVDTAFMGAIEKFAPEAGVSADNALLALTLAFPIQMLIIAFAIGTSVGVNALLSRSLGQQDYEKTNKTAGNGMFLGMVICVCFMLFGVFCIKAYLGFQTSNQEVVSLCTSYLRICCLINFGCVGFAVFEKMLQATGKTVFSTIAQILGAITNIILDPILIYGLCGFPTLGVAGAAYATVIGQIVSFLVAAVFHFRKNKEIKFAWKYVKPDWNIIKEIYVIGLPAIVMQALMSFMTFGVNIIFKSVSESAVTAYGIFYKIQQFLFFAALGLRDAITPIVSFNYGMNQKKRVTAGIRSGVCYVSVIMVVGIVVLELFADQMTGWFSLKGETAELCALAIRIIAPGFIFAGLNIALQGVYQALGCGLSSLVVSLLRLCVVVLPLAYLFTLLENARVLIWLAFPIAELVAAIVAIGCYLRAKRVLIDTME